MVVFARQNVISDPPFSRIDLISCRNLLIYLEPESAEARCFPSSTTRSSPGGFLYLGASESIGGFTELFEPVDKKHKIYAKKVAPTPAFHAAGREGARRAAVRGPAPGAGAPLRVQAGKGGRRRLPLPSSTRSARPTASPSISSPRPPCS